MLQNEARPENSTAPFATRLAGEIITLVKPVCDAARTDRTLSRSIGLARLSCALEPLSRIDLTDEQLQSEIITQAANTERAAKIEKLRAVGMQLDNGRVLVKDPAIPDGVRYVEVGDQHDRYAANIEALMPDVNDPNEPESLLDGPEIYEAIIADGCQQAIMPKAEKLERMLSNLPTFDVPRPRRGLANIFLGALGDHRAKLEATKGQSRYQGERADYERNLKRAMVQIDKASTELAESLQTLSDSPAVYLASKYIDTVKNRLAAEATSRVRADLAERNGLQITAPGSEQTTQVDTVVSREKIKTRGQAALVEVETEAVAEESYEAIGTREVILPWLNGGQPVSLEFNLMQRSAGKVYVTKAIPEQLQYLSDSVREKSRTKKGEVNELDQSIEFIATQIADGHLPWHRTTRFKLMRDDLRPNYEGLTIASYQEHRNGGVRTYFAIKKMSEISTQENVADEMVLIVLSETDKANQAYVISHFFKKSNGESRDRSRRGSK